MPYKHKYLITTSTQVKGVKERIIDNMKVEYAEPITQENIEAIKDKIINSLSFNMATVAITNIFKFETPAE